MKKRLLSIILALLMICTSFAGCSSENEQSADASVQEQGGQSSQEVVTEEPAIEEPEEYQIKNIIYLIPDGGGYPLYDFANDVKTAGGFLEDFANRTPTNPRPMTMRKYLAGSMTTLNYSEALTDSAAAGTAMSTGYKTINGRVGINHEGKPMANILEAAQSKGKATGLVATYEWMHATPASFSAHVMTRGDYYNLYQQIENQGIDVILGSGYGAVADYASIENAIDRGYTIIKNRQDLENVKPGDRIWGDATNNSSPYDIYLTAEQPTLEEMTKAAITALSGDEDGFFLMVEGSKVDTGGHANDALVTTSEYLAFDAAFKVAVDFAKERNDTVVIAAPDHDTGDMQYDKIERLMAAVTAVQMGEDYNNIKWGTTSHSTQQVGVWVYLPEGIETIPGLNPAVGDTPETRTDYVIDNTAIAPYLASLIGVDLDELSKELFVDVTDIGRYSYSAGKFTFNNGDKYVYKNQSVYYENGEEKSLDGRVTLEAEGRFYVPSCMVTDEDFNHVNKEGEGMILGSGTELDPYVIDEEWKFVEFTGTLLSGETYSGKYFLQTKDLDLAGTIDYSGAGSNAEFAGIYNGNGYKINAELSVTGDQCLFPYVTGTVMNLGTTGSITSTGSYTAGIARSVREGAKLVNCYSTMNLSGNGVRGLVSSNYGTIENCFFGGTITASGGGYAIAAESGGSFVNCYYTEQDYSNSTGVEAVSVSDAAILYEKLNEGRANAAVTLGTEAADLRYWRTSEDNGMPELYIPVPTVSKVTIVSDSTEVNKGDGIKLSASVEGEFDPSQEIVWSIEGTNSSSETVIYEDGFLCVSEDETAQSFTVLAKSAYDGSVTDIITITVGQAVLTEADGSRARPFEISSANDFLLFTNAVNEGKNLSGLYFEQTADIDMAGVEGYYGIPSSNVFAGTYDGRGYNINLDYSSDADNSPFGTTSGVLMNISTTGKVAGVTRPSGIVRKITHEGVVINCYSDVDVTGVDEAAGVARSVYGYAANCYFTGTVSANATYPCTLINEDGMGLNNYSIGKEHYVSGDETIIVEDELTEDCIVKWLNDDREESAKLAGIAKSLLCDWEYSEENGAVLVREQEVN